jgi:Tfp pilus assembly protein PilF
MIAAIQYEMDDLEGATENFRRATQLSPKSELASRGLFHSLYGLGKFSEAFDEVARYRSLKRSSEYELTLDELLAEAEGRLKTDENDSFALELRDRVVGELRERPRLEESVE